MSTSPEARPRALADRRFFKRRVHGADPKRSNDVRTAFERDRSRVIHSAGFVAFKAKQPTSPREWVRAMSLLTDDASGFYGKAGSGAGTPGPSGVRAVLSNIATIV